jgi:hypothetical protein
MRVYSKQWLCYLTKPHNHATCTNQTTPFDLSYSIVQCPVGRDKNIVPTLAGGNNVRGQLPGTQTSIQRDRPTTTALGRSPLDLPRQ